MSMRQGRSVITNTRRKWKRHSVFSRSFLKKSLKKLLRDKIRIFAIVSFVEPFDVTCMGNIFFIKSEHHRAQLVDKVLEFQDCMQNVNMSDDQVF